MEGQKQVGTLRLWKEASLKHPLSRTDQGELLPLLQLCSGRIDVEDVSTWNTWNHQRMLLSCCSRDVQAAQDQPVPGEGSLSDNSSERTAAPLNAARGLFVGSDRECEGNQSVPRRQQNLQQNLQPHPPPQLPGQAFPRGPLAGPTTSFRARFPGPGPAWHRGRRPTGNAAILWGFQQIRRDFPDARPGYRNPAGQGRNMYRGQRGGSFNGM